MSTLAGSKLTYFDLPGRAEAIRLALLHAGVEFEDKRIQFQDWPGMKPSIRWGGLPSLELASGATLMQSHSILRFVGRETALYPTDPLEAQKVDELLDAVEDIGVALNAVGRGMEKEAKEAARKEAALTGKIANSLKHVEEFVKANGSDGHAIGSALTIADFFLFVATSMIACGFYDGVPKETLDPYPTIQAIRKATINLPAVLKFYEASHEGAREFFYAAKDL